MPRTTMICFAALLTLAALGSAANAQPLLELAAPKRGTIPGLTPVPAPAARCVALSAAHGLLAFGHDMTYPAAQVTLVKLDAKGNPSATSTSWKLPRPEPLAKPGTYVTGLAFHPKLPLLYVWQDVNLSYAAPPASLPAERYQLDHLLIYEVNKNPPALLAALCRGSGFLFGHRAGTPAVDPAGTYLYVPNLQDPKNATYLHFGRFPLDADGLPVLDTKDAKLPREQRAQALVARSARAPFHPKQMTPQEYVSIFPNSGYGCGMSYHFVGPDAVLTGGARGVLLWQPEDKNMTVSALPVKDTHCTLLAPHPTRPVVYAAAFETNALYRVEHADGYPTLVPQRWTLPAKRRVLSVPQVLGKGDAVVVGGDYRVFLIRLDSEGRARPEVIEAAVNAPLVRALIYSSKFDRLYVGTEVSK